MKAHLKDKPVQVLLNDQEEHDLAELVKLERKSRGNVRLGAATLLREFAMPVVREKLADARKAA